jgi:hypothetical protein
MEYRAVFLKRGQQMREAILNELSIHNVMKHTEYTANELPDRYSGNSNERSHHVQS